MFMCRLKGNRAFIWLRQNNLPLAEDNVKKKEKKKKNASYHLPVLSCTTRPDIHFHSTRLRACTKELEI